MDKYDRENPFFAKIKKKSRLSSFSAKKDTQHIELDISESGIEYSVGDCVAILPLNKKAEVASLLRHLQLSGDESIQTRKGEKKRIEEHLLKEANLSKGNKKLLALLAEKSPHPKWKQIFESPDQLKELLHEKNVIELLLDAEELSLEAQELADALLPLMPRFYSIASSQKAHPHEVHLTVAMHSYFLGEKEREGVCSKFLLEDAQENDRIPLYVHKHRGFTLPEDSQAAIIMIGPGTGIAPFRGFLEERLVTGATGKNWLFFGEWHQKHTFYYGEWLTEVEKGGNLRLDCAFSRDQEHKVYVQHLMLQKSSEFFSWVEEGAYIYLCGDASRMAKDVEKALLQIIQMEGNMDESSAKLYLKSLAKSGHYLKDVY